MRGARLFIVDGVSSVWKADLVRYVDHVLVSATMVRKLTTRAKRPGEDPRLMDLEHVDAATFDRVTPDYVYEYAGERYGIQRSRLLSALRAHQSVFVIARNAEIISQLRVEFSSYCPVSVFVHMDTQLAANRGLGIKNPLVRDAVKSAFTDYLRTPESYDHVVVNGGSQNDFFRLLNLLIKRGASGVLALSDAAANRTGLLVLSTIRTRRVLQAALAVTSTVAAGFAVNIATRGAAGYWEMLCLGLNGSVLITAVCVEVALQRCWHERT
jgi:guanylate kinase